MRNQEVTRRMRPLSWTLLAMALAVLAPHSVFAELPLPPNLVALHSLQGEQMLLEATFKGDYFLLSEHFVQQQNWAFCGAASSAMVLNALGVPRPLQDPATGLNKPEYAYFAQDSVFNNDTERVVPQAVVRMQGLGIDQLSGFLAAHTGTSSSFMCIKPGEAMPLDVYRAAALKALALPSMFVIVNFDRAVVGESGGGHHSPVAAYHEPSDSLLVLDVSRYKYEAWWVPVQQLYAASTSSVDPVTGMTRGLVFAWATDAYPNQADPITTAVVPADTDNGDPPVHATTSSTVLRVQRPEGLSAGGATGLAVCMLVVGVGVGILAVTAYKAYQDRHSPADGMVGNVGAATKSLLAGPYPGYNLYQGYKAAPEGEVTAGQQLSESAGAAAHDAMPLRGDEKV